METKDDPPKYIHQIRTWIEACNELHGQKCRSEPIPNKPPQDVPMWLIDTHQNCIVLGITAHRYLALSYVWPENRTESKTFAVPHTLLLDNSNIANLQRPRFLLNDGIKQRIPHVIWHAMALTRSLGERFLWVDRLCIVQDDVGPGGTLSQVAKMDKIYTGAWLTIVAAAPETMYNRSVTTEWPSFCSVIQPYSRPPCMTQPVTLLENRKIGKQEIISTMIDRYGVLDQSTWATRGWTYQEQILCKRSIIFVEDGLFWHCECCMWDGVDLLPNRDFHRVAVQGQKIDAKWWPDFNLYLDTICPYNGREFSYPQDALLGISGILSAMLSSFPGGFISGLPRLFLNHTLLWQPFGVTKRRVDRQDDIESHASLPSYSWCGWQCFVEPSSLRSGLSYIGKANCQQHAESWRTQHTVNWNVRIAASSLEMIREPHELDECVHLNCTIDNELPLGWARRDSAQASFPASMPFISGFVHEKDNQVLFTHPIPLPTKLLSQNDVTASAQLEGSTTTATFLPATILLEVCVSIVVQHSARLTSIFDSLMFKLGPGQGKACPVLVLRTPLGGFAGLLQLMDNENIEDSVSMELIAISKGSANGRDMRQSYLWTVFETCRKGYNHDSMFRTFGYAPDRLGDHSKAALIVDLNMAFSKEAADLNSYQPEIISTLKTLERRCETWSPPEQGINSCPSLIEGEKSCIEKDDCLWQKDYGPCGSWLWHRNRFLRKRIKAFETRYTSFRDRKEKKDRYEFHTNPEENYRFNAPHRWSALKDMILNGSFFEHMRNASPDHPYSKPSELLCEFYNVLWIERKDGIAYRRACGWVPKHIWEAHATGPVWITLG
jgi:hypothetical protein